MKNAILIPAYNEEKNILKIIQKAKKIRNFSKIIVIDDGSKDKTGYLAKKTGVIVLQHKKNRGKGEAIKSGFKYIMKKFSKIENIVVIDADLQYKPEESKKFLEALNEADFVMGYRNWKKVPFRHKLGNLVWRFFFNLLFGTKLKDTNCGFIGLSKRVFKKMDFGGGYVIENRMLIYVIENGFKIKQVPVKVNYKKVSGIKRGVRVVLGISIFIIKEGIEYRLSRLK